MEEKSLWSLKQDLVRCDLDGANDMKMHYYIHFEVAVIQTHYAIIGKSHRIN